MPAIFKNMSQQNQKFGCDPAYTFDMWCGADLEPDKNALTVEPPLQHKKRVAGPPTSLSTEYFSVPSQSPDYALLGQQEKFASNVRYPVKEAVKGGMYKNKENFDSVPSPNKQLRMQKRIKPLIKERHPPVSRSPDTRLPLSPPPAPREHKDCAELKTLKDKDLRDILGDRPAVTDAVKSDKPAAKRLDKPDVRKLDKPDISIQDRPSANKSEKAAAASKLDKAVLDKPEKSHSSKIDQPAVSRIHKTYDSKSDKLAMDRSGDQIHQLAHTGQKKKEASNMNEFAQTNMRKGIAVSAPEAPADYALKYKAGVAPPRPVRKISEYQREFQWKQGMKASPLLAAEEVVYRSNSDLGPYKRDGVQRLSEYQRQFHSQKPLAYSYDASINMNNSNKNNNSERDVSVKKTAVIKRSRSTGAALPHDEAVDLKKDDRSAESGHEELKPRLRRLHGKIRHIETEYRANFKSPTMYSYEHGAWRGAFPPQLQPQIRNNEDVLNKNTNKNDENPPLSNWFAEVMELRRRAEEYRKRAQGTHFSRDHLLQLVARRNESWGSGSDISSTINALNLETPTVRPRVHKQASEKPREDRAVPDEINSELSDADDTEQLQELTEERRKRGSEKGRKGEKVKKDRISRKMAWLEEQKEKLAEQRRRLEEERVRQEYDEYDDDDDDVVEEKQEGRLPTPQLQQSASPTQRHHLDLTTPSIGGALLTSPPSRDNKLVVTSRTGGSYVTASDDYPAKSLQKTYNINRLHASPVYGKPTEDTHLLRNDSARSDSPLRTQYTVSPPLPSDDEDKENQKNQKQSRRKNRNLRSGDLTAVPEGYGRTYSVAKPRLNLADIQNDDDDDNDDALSESLVSVASSRSLASDVLERTKKRQQFWSQKD